MRKYIKCPYCGETILSVLVLRFNTSDRPEAQEKDIKFCPFCGFHVEGGSASDKDLVVD